MIMRLWSPLVVCLLTTGALRGTTIVVPPGSPGWSAEAGGAGGGTVTHVSLPSLGANGSVRLTGDRVRYYYGNPYTVGPQTNFGLLFERNGVFL